MSIHITSKCPLSVRTRQVQTTRDLQFNNLNTATAHNGDATSGSYTGAGLYQGLTACDTEAMKGLTECCNKGNT